MVNLFWTCYNIWLVAIAVSCAVEHRYTRRAHRIRRNLNVVLTDADGDKHEGITVLATEFGSLVKTRSTPKKGQLAKLHVSGTVHGTTIDVDSDCEIRYIDEAKDSNLVGLLYLNQSTEQLRRLILLTYCEPSLWAKLSEPRDSILGSAWTFITTPFRVAAGTTRQLKAAHEQRKLLQSEESRLLAEIAPMPDEA